MDKNLRRTFLANLHISYHHWAQKHCMKCARVYSQLMPIWKRMKRSLTVQMRQNEIHSINHEQMPDSTKRKSWDHTR